ncbi:MAG: AAA family ATPase [Candidatus Competibacteraceae bacterium]|nr:AAA family ATPase [Candidatus Competibacteraceae bacterium]
MNKIRSVALEGYKSFCMAPLPASLPPLPGQGHATHVLRLDDVTLLIGPNGAGKSALTNFFNMLNFMTSGALQEYVGRSGGANSILHYGAKRTPMMHAELELEEVDAATKRAYAVSLAHAAGDTLIFTEESTSYGPAHNATRLITSLGAGHRESELRNHANAGDPTARFICGLLNRCRAYQFHDTSPEANIRQGGFVEDNVYLRNNAGNLAAFLRGIKLREDSRGYYERIVQTIQLAFPQLKDFVLEPQALNEKYVMLNWTSEDDSSYLFGPHQLSDGALRFAALTTLLLQPPDKMPSLIVLDEPELGLHPQAIVLLAELLKSAAATSQVLVATQSPVLVDQFELANIRPIEQHSGHSVILDLDPEAYAGWLQEYSAGELWTKNLIGGGPTHG